MVEYPEPVLAQSGDLQDTIKQTKSRDNEMQLGTTAITESTLRRTTITE